MERYLNAKVLTENPLRNVWGNGHGETYQIMLKGNTTIKCADFLGTLENGSANTSIV
jgi:hypothetical protein